MARTVSVSGAGRSQKWQPTALVPIDQITNHRIQGLFLYHVLMHVHVIAVVRASTALLKIN
jgi:hypothetical protein